MWNLMRPSIGLSTMLPTERPRLSAVSRISSEKLMPIPPDMCMGNHERRYTMTLRWKNCVKQFLSIVCTSGFFLFS